MHHPPVGREPVLTIEEQAFLAAARRAVLATVDPTGLPRLVPICHVLAAGAGGGPPVLYTPLDEKPKSVDDPRRLARVRDLEARPQVVILVDRWDEDWRRLAWLRASGPAEVMEPEGDADRPGGEHAAAVAALRRKYPQYADHALEGRPIIRVTIGRVSAWGDLGGPA